jgi:hypothetical protein
MALTGSQAEADKFGRNHLPDFCGESVEIDMASRADAEEFWRVRTVRLVHVLLDPERRPQTATAVAERKEQGITMTQIFVRGPKLPDDVESAGLLTPEDHRDLTKDHIGRTSDLVGHIEILKWA